MHNKDRDHLFQIEGRETINETCERFKDLIRRCPHHGISEWVQMELFYYGLNVQSCMIVDTSAGGCLLNKSVNENMS